MAKKRDVLLLPLVAFRRSPQFPVRKLVLKRLHQKQRRPF